jgi:hypothetical protein
MVYANQPRLKKKPRAGSDPAANNNDLTTVEDVDEFEEDAQYGVSDAINKQVGEFNFEQRVVQGKSCASRCISSHSFFLCHANS